MLGGEQGQGSKLPGWAAAEEEMEFEDTYLDHHMSIPQVSTDFGVVE